ncbi:replication initiator protein A [Facklamia miroungae]|uniref:Replication initiator protein A (RepA) N-terminus n=1 Tax=Facklamia miroungae TaxID=120956 RepID=A0A1G7RE85_9LACT|nr:replication initiator protein A [Facklamia miroungae]NKZ29449.1 hypothetical protein [Facklamia miroungae]SDG08945.1 Replication initiator protein A (RepA) N-terminus [Facklamia miroungae]
MEFDYFYNLDGDRYSFYMLPKIVFSGTSLRICPLTKNFLIQFTRMNEFICKKYNWRDDKKRVYIIFSIDQVMEVLNKSNQTSVKVLIELEKIGLIKRKGLGKSNSIYVKDFVTIVNTNCFVRLYNVYLTEKEIQTLREEIPYHLDNFAERLSAYMKRTGRDYNDHKSTILSSFYQD